MSLVLLLRRDPETLSDDEEATLRQAFGENVKLERIDPVDYLQHAAICRERQPDAVLLPLERPIPSLAMEEGFRHVVCGPSGQVMQLEPMQVKFSPLEKQPH